MHSKPHLRVRSFHGLALLCGVFLSACQLGSPVKINQQIDKGHYGNVISKLEKAIAKTPADPTLNALLLKARLLQCAEVNCTKGNQFDATSFTGPAQYAVEAVTLEDGTQLRAQLIHEALAPRFAALPDQPAPILRMMSAAPEKAKYAYPNALFMQVKTDLQANRNDTAAELLTTLTRSTDLAPTLKNIAGMLLGDIQQKPALKEGYAIALRNDKDAVIPPAAAQAYFYLLSKKPGFPSQTLAELSAAKIPTLMEISALQAMAEEVNSLTPETGGVEHMALSLTLNPNQPQLWQTFLPLAEADALKSADASYFANLTQFAPLPAEVQSQFLTSVFKLIETRSAAKQSILPLLQSVGQIKLNKTNETRLEKLVQTGLVNALAAESVEEVLAYARFRPAIAQANRQNITPLMVSSIRTDLQKEQFERVIELGDTLQQIGIDFDMDALLLQELEESFKAKDTAGELSANNADWLLKQPSAARLDLGPLFAFTQDYFEDKPEVLTAQLKNLAVSAHGAYGLPSALYRLDSYFDETSFPEDQRQIYLASAITRAVENDTTHKPAQLMDLISQLTITHPGLNLPPLISSLLGRASEVTQARELWQAAGGTARDILARTHPQFTSLMKAIDAMEQKNLDAAADALNQLQTASYADMARPYVTTLRQTLAGMAGIYVAQNPNLPNGSPAIIILSAPALQGVADLTQLNVTFINALGDVKISNPKTLETDHAAITPQTVPSTVNFARSTLSPANGASPLFTRLTLLPSGSDEGSTLTWQNGKTTATFTRVLHSPYSILPPMGTYSINANLNNSTILPEGSLLELSGDPAQLTGKIWHPASVSPLPATAKYDAATATTRLSFGYPLPASSQPAWAEVKCQILPGYLRCGAHHRHSAREEFAALFHGTTVAESMAGTQLMLQAANKEADASQEKNLLALPVLAGEAEAQAAVLAAGSVIGSNGISATLIHASPTDLLAAPVLPSETDSPTSMSPAAVISSATTPPSATTKP